MANLAPVRSGYVHLDEYRCTRGHASWLAPEDRAPWLGPPHCIECSGPVEKTGSDADVPREWSDEQFRDHILVVQGHLRSKCPDPNHATARVDTVATQRGDASGVHVHIWARPQCTSCGRPAVLRGNYTHVVRRR
jgi:hypothetical protein